MIEHCGYPLKSLWGGVHIGEVDSDWGREGKPPNAPESFCVYPYQAYGAIRLNSPPLGGRRSAVEIEMLPYFPIWPGFAINTLFYAAILWLLFAAPGFVRRRVRIRRGQCGACGYDLRGQLDSKHKTCPECGANA